MSPLQQLLVQARSAAAHVAEPAYRRGAAVDARAFEQKVDVSALIAGHSVAGLLALMKALPDLNSAEAINLHGAALNNLATGIQAAIPRPTLREPRRHWIERERA